MQKNVSRLLKIAAAFAAPLLIGSAAQADSIMNLIDQNGSNQLSDENREFLIDRIGENNVIDVGDSIRGFAAFDQLLRAGVPTINLGVVNNELTAVFQLLVTGKKPIAGQPGTFQFTFGPDPTFAEAAGGGATAIGTAMAVLYEDVPGNVNLNDNTASGIATAEATSTNGTPFWYLGFTNPALAAHFLPGGDGIPGTSDDVLVTLNGEGWVGEGSDDLNITLPSGNSFGVSNFAINRVSTAGTGGSLVLVPRTGILNTLGQPPVGSIAEFIGKADNVGPDFGPFPLWSDTRLAFTTAALIPLPAAVWGGLGLMGLMGFRRMRKAKRE